jgi:hypothetical protein
MSTSKLNFLVVIVALTFATPTEAADKQVAEAEKPVQATVASLPTAPAKPTAKTASASPPGAGSSPTSPAKSIAKSSGETLAKVEAKKEAPKPTFTKEQLALLRAELEKATTRDDLVALSKKVGVELGLKEKPTRLQLKNGKTKIKIFFIEEEGRQAEEEGRQADEEGRQAHERVRQAIERVNRTLEELKKSPTLESK